MPDLSTSLLAWRGQNPLRDKRLLRTSLRELSLSDSPCLRGCATLALQISAESRRVSAFAQARFHWLRALAERGEEEVSLEGGRYR